jgi:hypothetical protein
MYSSRNVSSDYPKLTVDGGKRLLLALGTVSLRMNVN